jgi:enoyl-CoA hydratase/carnithine racemase
MDDPVLVTIDAGVAEVCLNRPARKNAWNMAMFDALAAAAESLRAVAGLRAVILHGAGACFSAGLDLALLGEFAQDLPGIRQQMLTLPDGEVANRFQKPCYLWQTLPVPVIAAIEGVAFGAGMQLALAADFRIAAPDARLSIMEAKWGLIPDMGISQSLPHLLRADVAKELIMTGRILTADEAQALGLVTRVAMTPLHAARALAHDLAARSPDQIAAAKALVDGAWSLPAREGLALEARLQADIIGGANQIEAVMANTAGRPPRFT